MIGAYSMQKILISILIFISLASYADEKKALKLLEKKDYDKLIETLDKDIEKDSLNPGSYYIYSLLYNDPGFKLGLFMDYLLSENFYYPLCL